MDKRMKNPTRYAIMTCQPDLTYRTTDFASWNLFERATPAEDPNQTMDPPNPTA